MDNFYIKNLTDGASSSNSYANNVENAIKTLYEKTANVIITTTGVNDIQTAINSISDNQVIEIKTNATYNPIVIPASKKINIRTAIGYMPKITGTRCISISNGASGVIISGLIIESANNTGGNNNQQGSAITYATQSTICQDIIFHNITIKNVVTGSAVMLSYHWSVGGDNYANPPQLSELSKRIAFVGCNFYRACLDGTEGACISIRGVDQVYIAKNIIDNFKDAGRGIQLQGCLNSYVYENDVRNIGGTNAEGIKIDEIGISPFRQTSIIEDNYVSDCIEGIDVDDNVSAIVNNNVAVNCSDEGISLDDSSYSIMSNNICFNCTTGILFELGSIGYLTNSNCFNNINNYKMDNGYVPNGSNISDSSKALIEKTINSQRGKTLTEGISTPFIEMYIKNNSANGLKIKYTIEAVNASTDVVEVHYGELLIVARNQAGVITNNSNHVPTMELDLPIGTGIADTFTVTNGVGKVTISVTATSGITPSKLVMYYMINFYGETGNYKEL